MPTTDPRVDAYIAASADFARPVLTHLRAVVHAACPEVEETMKWNFPHFMYKGILCSMASFKAHCAFGFWHKSMREGAGAAPQEAMGQFGRITAVTDLPPKKTLAGYVKKAMQLNAEGGKAALRPKPAAPELTVPDYFLAALSAPALEHFKAFSKSQQREYVDWVTEAKTEATRLRRLEQSAAWLDEGKVRNWKYAKC